MVRLEGPQGVYRVRGQVSEDRGQRYSLGAVRTGTVIFSEVDLQGLPSATDLCYLAADLCYTHTCST